MNDAAANVDADSVTAPPPSFGSRWRAPLHVYIGTLFNVLIVVAGGAIAWHNFVQNRDLTFATADQLFAVMGRESRAELSALRNPAELLVDLLARQRLAEATTLDERMASVPFLATALKREPALSALYAGYDDGAFFLLRRIAGTAAEKELFAPPAGAAFVVQSVERGRDGAARGSHVFLDAALQTIARRDLADYKFDPRTRGWYREARVAEHVVRTAPYVFFTTREVGITLARRSQVGPAVVGADVTLLAISRALAGHLVTPSAEIMVLGEDGVVFADRRPERLVVATNTDGTPRLANARELGVPAITALMARFDPALPEARHTIPAGGREWEAAVFNIDDDASRGHPRAYLAVLAPRDELLGDAWRITRSSVLLTLAILLLCLPIAWLLSRLLSGSLTLLTADARAVRRFDFGTPIATRSGIREIGELAGTMDSMKTTIRRFLDIAATVNSERRFERLLARVLAETLPATGSQGGAIYLVGDDGALAQAAARTERDECATATTALPEDHVVRRALAAQRTIVEPLPAAADARRQSFGPVAEAVGPAPHAAIVIPLTNRQHANVGALALFHDVSAGEPSHDLVAFAEALSGTIGVAIENQSLLAANKALLDAVIRLIAGAIDAKSPYTGGHCQRVPELTLALARAACDAKSGPLRDFSLSDDEWEALSIAAWLHDCGKVTTPEYVVDKATKLETIYDRLHEIRTRFEVLKRDAGIECWRGIAEGGDRAALLAELARRHRELDDEFAFVAACNGGGESIAPEALERLKRIGARTWQRTLDDRLGLSQEELARRQAFAAVPLPATEQLLADKPEHLVARGSAEHVPPQDRWGFHLEPPPYKSNLGELYNLSIGRGTLTAEDRYRINDHVVRTIMMLSELPLTGTLKRVPEMAGGHHERVDGKGYPRQLSGGQMSVEARMMAIADVFEALTAADRPYKKAKTLSDALRIMARMRDAGHLDPDLFDLFLEAGIPLDYARQHLRPAQIDVTELKSFARAVA